MMFKKNLVVCLKVNGKVLRESSDRVELPFGSEYSVLVKNLNSVRAEFRIQIDGKDTSGTWFVVGPNQSVEIERFLKNGNLSQGNRFKFIERTSEIEETRGIEAEDGLIRVEYRFEKKQPIVTVTESHHYHHDHYDWRYGYNYWYPYSYPKTTWTLSGSNLQNANYTNSSTSGAITSNTVTTSSIGQIKAQSMNMLRMADSGSLKAEQNDAGITVPGSISNQQFQNVAGFETESQTEVIVLKLVGRHGKVEVKQPKTVDVKNKCVTCSKTNKANAKFCSQCGTSLTIL